MDRDGSSFCDQGAGCGLAIGPAFRCENQYWVLYSFNFARDRLFSPDKLIVFQSFFLESGKSEEKAAKNMLTSKGKSRTISHEKGCSAASKARAVASDKHKGNKHLVKGGSVTQRAIKQLETLRRATARYSPRVKAQLSKAGKKPNSATAESAAKYYIALKKLASK